MEDNNVSLNEIDVVEETPEVEEESDTSGGGALVAGIVGGFLAYAAISGGKKLRTFVVAKLAERRRKEKTKDEVVDAEHTEVSDKNEQEDSKEEDPEKK